MEAPKYIYQDFHHRYQLLDYLISHSQLVIRSMKRHKQRSYNIDIIFKPVEWMQMGTNFDGIAIQDLGLVDESYGTRKFRLTDSQGQEHFIIAMAFYVYHNELEILESPVKSHMKLNTGELKKSYCPKR